MYGGLSFFRVMSVSGIAASGCYRLYGEAGPIFLIYPATPLVALAAAPAPICVPVGLYAARTTKRGSDQTRPRRRAAPPPGSHVVDPYPTFNGIALDTQTQPRRE